MVKQKYIQVMLGFRLGSGLLNQIISSRNPGPSHFYLKESLQREPFLAQTLL